jgi:cyclopropane fatty-acyl-phospholipid synthase-like methyltransferase
MATRAELDNAERFTDRYRQCCEPVRVGIERQALGTDYGSTGYTTRAEADELARLLDLAPGVRLADIGAGSGWPGLYLAAATGCRVIGTDLPLDGLRQARARSARDGAAVPATYAVATGRRQPLRTGSCDAVVHTDVLCCLGPKLAALRECHRLLRRGGRMAFTTIHLAEGLGRKEHRRAVRAGPPHVISRRPYTELVVQAGFSDVEALDVTESYARTQQTWCEASEAHAVELIGLTSERDFALAQADRRRTRDAIADGLLRRCVVTARRWS